MRLALLAVAIPFVAVEALVPTHGRAKALASHALVLRAQDGSFASRASLGASLLDDLPRIHPDALGAIDAVRVTRRGASLVGHLEDPYERLPGLAVFLIVDERRSSAARVRYDRRTGRFAIDADALAPGARDLGVGLIASDQRGFFLAPPIARVRIPGAS